MIDSEHLNSRKVLNVYLQLRFASIKQPHQQLLRQGNPDVAQVFKLLAKCLRQSLLYVCAHLQSRVDLKQVVEEWKVKFCLIARCVMAMGSAL